MRCWAAGAVGEVVVPGTRCRPGPVAVSAASRSPSGWPPPASRADTQPGSDAGLAKRRPHADAPAQGAVVSMGRLVRCMGAFLL